MTIKQLEYYIKTCEKSSITLAAEELYSSRSAVSKAIHELEEEFGTALLERSKNGVIPTLAGERLLREAITIHGGYVYLKNTIQNINSTHEMTIRIAQTRSCSSAFYHDYVAPYLDLHPDASFMMHEYNATEVISRLDAGEYDLAVTSVVSDSDKYEGTVFNTNRICLVVPKDDKDLAGKEYITIEDIADIPLGFATATVPLEKTLKKIISTMGRSCNIAIKTSDYAMLIDMMRRGKVYPVIAEEMAKDLEDVKVFLLPVKKYLVFNSQLVWRKMPSRSETVQQFIDFVKARNK